MKNYIIILCFISFALNQVFSHYDYTGSRATSMSGAVTSGPGNSDNILTMSELSMLLKKNKLKISFNDKVCYLTK